MVSTGTPSNLARRSCEKRDLIRAGAISSARARVSSPKADLRIRPRVPMRALTSGKPEYTSSSRNVIVWLSPFARSPSSAATLKLLFWSRSDSTSTQSSPNVFASRSGAGPPGWHMSGASSADVSQSILLYSDMKLSASFASE